MADLKHKAERAAFDVAITAALKHVNKGRGKAMCQMVDLVQKVLKDTWGETEIYAYIETLLDDFLSVNANVVFKEDFSLETESKELDALRKLYDDVNFTADVSLEEFLQRLSDSRFRYAVGAPLEIEGIEEVKEGDVAGYHVSLEYYANVDSLMRVPLEVTIGGNGKFSAENSFPEAEKK